MPRFLAATVLVAVFIVGCASAPPLEFQSYRACHETPTGGRMLHDPGSVVGELWDGQEKVFQFQADELPKDGKHIKDVKRINRFCPVARNGIVSNLPRIDQ